MTDLVVTDGTLTAASGIVDTLVDVLGVSRSLVASNEEIKNAISQFQKIVIKMPVEHRDELIARMYIATSVGLFDGAVNYVWNATVNHLRNKIRDFGLPFVASVMKKDFGERELTSMKDVELLRLCLNLNLISQQGYFFLDQTRDVRNHYSAAHPSSGNIDDFELIANVSRCIKHAFLESENAQGIDFKKLMKSVASSSLDDAQTEYWLDSFTKTVESQRVLVFGTLHGIYCGNNEPEEKRNNALHLLLKYNTSHGFSNDEISSFVVRHEDYILSGKSTASENLFEQLGLLEFLSESTRHSLITRACKNLWDVHKGMDNFYNEPPFAERLLELSQQAEVPDTAKVDYVSTVVGCAIGNGYGVAHNARQFYYDMVGNFSPREVTILLSLPEEFDNDESLKVITVSQRINRSVKCKSNYRRLLTKINEASIPTQVISIYHKFMEEQ